MAIEGGGQAQHFFSAQILDDGMYVHDGCLWEEFIDGDDTPAGYKARVCARSIQLLCN